nr:integrase, catalytic region, zinc finger, CCHC-type, peptidase aspartic, catalytic [Tanacetum cinerariifolium]
DAPSANTSSSQEQEHSLIISQGVEESPKTPHFHDDPLHETLHEDSNSQGSSSNVQPSHTTFELLSRWTKIHPIANVIRDPSRSVSTRKQLKTDVMWCYFDAFLTSVEPKKFKEAMLESSWIKAIKIRTPRAVVTQEPPSVQVKKIQESSGKLKGIKMLSEATQLELATQKAIKDSQRISRLKHKTESLIKGTGVSLGVLNELKGVSVILKTNKDKNDDDDEDDSNKEEEDKEESVNEEENNQTLTIKTEEEETADSEHEEVDTKGEDQKTKEEPKGDDQAKQAKVGVLDLVTNKEKVQGVYYFTTSVIQSTIKETLKQTPVVSAQSSSQPQSSYAVAESLTEFDLKKILIEKMKRNLFESYSQPVSLKRNREKDKDKDPFVGPNQRKETKKRRTRKEAESSKKSLNPKESTKGKPPSKSSKTSKSASAGQSVKEPKHEADPKIPKKDWFKDSPKPEVLDPEWNTLKTIDDTPEHPWFNKMVQVVKPPLTFDEYSH